MNNVDIISKRVLSIAISITIVLCAISLFVFSLKSINTVNASVPENNMDKYFTSFDGSGIEIYPIGIHNDKAYWLEYVDKWHYRSKDLSEWK